MSTTMNGSNPKTKDFDSFWDEQEREPVRIKVFGEWHDLPPIMPAAVVIRVIRLQKEYGPKHDIPESDMIDIGDHIFGADRMKAWFDKGLDIEQLSDLINWSMDLYTGANNQAPVGKAEERPAGLTSLNTGRSSKRTSSASTKSTSRKRASSGA